MADKIILASASEIRRKLLTNANLKHTSCSVEIDEKALLQHAVEDGLDAREIALKLAEMKAMTVARVNQDAIVIGCDQVLECNGALMSKPANKEQGVAQLRSLAGQKHRLFSAVSIVEYDAVVWYFVGVAELEMRALSEREIAAYLERNWHEVRHCVGCYMLEKEGAWLFTEVKGDYFTVLGLPIIQLLGYLSSRGVRPE